MEDRKILDLCPLPISRGFLRYKNASEPRHRHDAAYYLFEILIKYVASIAMARYLAGEARDHRLNAVLKGLARPSLGEWVRFLRECLGFLSSMAEPDPLIVALTDLHGRKQNRWPAAVCLLNALRSFRSGGESQKEQTSLAILLDELVTYRNRVLGHGALLPAEHYRRFSDFLAEAFAEVLDHASFLNAARLVLFDSIQVEEGSRIECSVVDYMGCNPVRRGDPITFPYGQESPRKGALYLLNPDGASFLSLDPFCLALKDDLYFLNEAEGAIEYLSYSNGDRHRPASLEKTQESLFERILGYRPDSSGLSRLGDDLAPAAPPSKAEAKQDERRIGDYRLVREVGRGAMGVVFEAVQESLGRRVALKVLPGSFALDPRRVERFRREARATANVHHPSIIPVYEVGEHDGSHYYAMEFIAGPSLGEVLANERRAAASAEAGSSRRRRGSTSSSSASVARTVEAFAALADGLEEAHRRGLIHRDVKPSNIMIDTGGRHVLVDFGLVREVEAGTLTRSGEMVGTVGYMSPEQASRSPVDARADVYSLGATLYEALTLKPPFERASEHETQRAVLFEDPHPPRKLNPSVHRDLETIILCSLEKNPDRRYGSAAELAEDLRRFLRYQPIRARPQSIVRRIALRAARHRGKLAAAAVILVLLLLSGLLAFSSWRESRRRIVEEYEPRVARLAAKLQLGRLPVSLGAFSLRTAGAHGLSVRSNIHVLAPELRRDPVAEAVSELEQAASTVPSAPDAYYHRARGLLALGRDGEALEDLHRARAADPDFVPAMVLRAAVLKARGDAEEAERELTEAEARAGAGWAKVWLAANEAAAARDWTATARAYSDLIRLGRGAKERPYAGFEVEMRLARGVARLEAGDFTGAIDDFSFAGAREPAAVEPLLLKGKAFHAKGDRDQAREVFEELWNLATDKDGTALAVAALYQGLGDYAAGLDWAAEKLAGKPVHERTRAGFFYLERRWPEAMQALEAAVEADPRDAIAWNLYGWTVLEARDDLEGASRMFDKAISADPDLLGARLGKCEILERKNQVVEAGALYRELAGRYPREAWVRYHLGTFLTFLDRLPAGGGMPLEDESGTPSYGRDLAWLAALLRSGEPIRIRCGGGEYQDLRGNTWGRDCFFLGGKIGGSSGGFFLLDQLSIEGTEDDPLYQAERYFPQPLSGYYEIPLPPGRYRVTLHFAEYWFKERGRRIFDVLLEGRAEENYEPLAVGFATAEKRVFEDVPVTDGMLNLDFGHRVDAPKISAMEIERLK